jgi:hypothetical protein
MVGVFWKSILTNTMQKIFRSVQSKKVVFEEKGSTVLCVPEIVTLKCEKIELIIFVASLALTEWLKAQKN